MKRSQINKIVQEATFSFMANGWTLPPNPRWDVTDFGLGDIKKCGLVLVNFAEEAEYCEKLMYARKGQVTPIHTHKRKKEDIICRTGKLAVQVWNGHPDKAKPGLFLIKVNGENQEISSGDIIHMQSGERVTITPGIYHEVFPESEECIIGEVSTANDDENDNFFANEEIVRFSNIDEDELAVVNLVSD